MATKKELEQLFKDFSLITGYIKFNSADGSSTVCMDYYEYVQWHKKVTSLFPEFNEGRIRII
jgi:hypothetical protein